MQSASLPQPQNAGMVMSGCTQARPSGLAAQAVTSPPGTHSTQTLPGPHAGVAPAQAPRLVDVQTTQAPVATSQTGFDPPHSMSVEQPRQERVVGSHTGVRPRQSELPMHPTQRPMTVSHTGVEPVHAEVFVGEHWPQAPED